YGEAEALFAQCVALAPDFNLARYGHALTLIALHSPEAALVEAQELARRSPQNVLFQKLCAKVLEDIEDYEAAAAVWRALIESDPSQAGSWIHYARVLRGMGAAEECIAAYRKAIALDPACGAAWWGLSDLKTFRFGEAEAGSMERQLARADLPAGERMFLHF